MLALMRREESLIPFPSRADGGVGSNGPLQRTMKTNLRETTQMEVAANATEAGGLGIHPAGGAVRLLAKIERERISCLAAASDSGSFSRHSPSASVDRLARRTQRFPINSSETQTPQEASLLTRRNQLEQ